MTEVSGSIYATYYSSAWVNSHMRFSFSGFRGVSDYPDRKTLPPGINDSPCKPEHKLLWRHFFIDIVVNYIAAKTSVNVTSQSFGAHMQSFSFRVHS